MRFNESFLANVAINERIFFTFMILYDTDVIYWNEKYYIIMHNMYSGSNF